MVTSLKRGTMPEIVINSLYKYTPLETSFGIIMLAVVDNRPVLLNLKTALAYFLDHRREVVVRRTKFELRKAEAVPISWKASSRRSIILMRLFP